MHLLAGRVDRNGRRSDLMLQLIARKANLESRTENAKHNTAVARLHYCFDNRPMIAGNSGTYGLDHSALDDPGGRLAHSLVAHRVSQRIEGDDSYFLFHRVLRYSRTSLQ